MKHPTQQFRNRVVGYAVVDPKTLVPNDRNWRLHPDAQRAAMHGALKEVGWVGVITINKTTGKLVDGHLRREQAIAEKQDGIPAIYVELSEAEEAKVLASLDPIGAMAQIDREALDAILGNIEAEDEDFRMLLESLAAILGNIEAEDEDFRMLLESLAAPPAGDLLDPTEGNDDSGKAERVKALKFGDYEIPVTDAEISGLGRVADAYVEKNGAFFGFVSWLVKHVPA